MKVLYLYNMRRIQRNRRQLITSINALGKYCELYVYGPANKVFDYRAQKVDFEGSKSVVGVINRVKPDVVLASKVASFPGIRVSIGDLVPLVALEQEFCHWKVGLWKWMRHHKASAIILRGYWPEALKLFNCPVYWLPFSVNEQEFYTELVDHVGRKQKIVFLGHTNRRVPFYKTRLRALKKLKKAGLLGPPLSTGGFKYAVDPKDYPEKLKKYYGGLSCAFNHIHQMPLKTLEIMASGTAVLTQELLPEIKRQMFGDEQHYFVYKDDCSDVVEVAEELLYDDLKRKGVCERALHTVNMRHLDKHRVLELYEILQAVAERREHKSQCFELKKK